MTAQVAVVVIGRNEGERLLRCLDSVARAGAPVVYVDSGSDDGSPAAARARGADVVALDESAPFNAARARNEGLARLARLCPDVRYVQFVDGDCELHGDWIATAAAALDADPGVAAVSGRLRERNREASVYNRLCDMEWDAPPGDAASCGGVAMMRVSALRQVGGFRADMTFGEEPELCFRLRREGHRVRRLAAEMGTHDAAMFTFGQWWRRAARAGHAAAEGAALHGRGPGRHNVRKLLSMLFWGGGLPAAVVTCAVLWRAGPQLWMAPAAGAVAYGALTLKVYVQRVRAGERRGDAWLWAASCTVAKWPQFAGVVRFAANRLRRRPTAWVGYRSA